MRTLVQNRRIAATMGIRTGRADAMTFALGSGIAGLANGQQQQLAIARALTAQPRPPILDELTEGIQPNVIKEAGKVIRHLARDRNFAVVLVEQYFEIARDLADSITVVVLSEVALAGATTAKDEAQVRSLLTV